MDHRIARRRALASVAAALAGVAWAAPEKTPLPGGGAYPLRPIRLVVPLPAGGGADTVARIIADKLSARLGEQIIVDNKPGGGTVIGAEAVARAAPDGYTLLLGTATTHAINRSLVKSLRYDPVKDFEPVTLVAVLPLVLVAHPSVPASTLPELIEYARRHRGEVNFASTGNGSSIHLAGEMLNLVGKVQMTHVPYKGAAPALQDLLGGRVQFMFTTIPPALPHIQAGKLKAIAVAGSARAALLPDVPTTAEAGMPEVDASSWNGILAPAGTPKEIVDRLNAEIVAIMKESEVAGRLRTAGVAVLYGTPAEFARYIADETARYAKVVAASHARLD